MSNVFKSRAETPPEPEKFALSDVTLNELQPCDSVSTIPRVIRSEAESVFPVEAFDLSEATDAPVSVQGEVPSTPLEAEEDTAALAMADEAQNLGEDSSDPEPDWQHDADVVLEQARQEAARYVEEAQQQAESIRQEAYDAGLQQGIQVAQQEVEVRFASVCASLQQACEDLIALRTQTLRRAEDDIITLAFRLAEKILGTESRLNPTVLTAVLPRALEHLVAPGQVTVRIHPADLEQAQALQQDGRVPYETGTTLQLQADEAVERGGCVIESAFGTIDARLEAQFAELEQRFREQISHEVLPS